MQMTTRTKPRSQPWASGTKIATSSCPATRWASASRMWRPCARLDSAPSQEPTTRMSSPVRGYRIQVCLQGSRGGLDTLGHYSFKFDRRERLGMVAPIWTDYPGEVTPDRTLILLRLADDIPDHALVSEMRRLDSRLLLFLRRLRRLDLTISGGRDGPSWTSVLSRAEAPDKALSGASTTILQQDGCSEEYMLVRHIAENLPADPRRPEQSRSNITLAYPLPSDESPTRADRSQCVYASLPIRDYGFKVCCPIECMLLCRFQHQLTARIVPPPRRFYPHGQPRRH